jgi:hypothetical protein
MKRAIAKEVERVSRHLGRIKTVPPLPLIILQNETRMLFEASQRLMEQVEKLKPAQPTKLSEFVPPTTYVEI